MPNQNPTAIAVCNEKIRPVCRKLVDAKYALDEVAAEFVAVGGMALFPNDAELLEDGSPEDGRAQLTNAEVREIATFIGTVRTTLGAASFDTMVKAQAIGI